MIKPLLMISPIAALFSWGLFATLNDHCSFLVGLMAFYFFYIIAIGLLMFQKRFQAIQQKRISPKYFKSYQGEIDHNLKVFENHYNNQFQIPMMFFITCLTGIALNQTHLFFCIIAALFVITRLLHSWVHLTSNYLPYRASIFFFGACLVGVLWINLLINSL